MTGNRSFNNFKYLKSNLASRPLKNSFLVECFWLRRYLLADARFSKLNKQYTNKLLNYRCFGVFLKRSHLRSICFFSRFKFSISKYLFWYGRHVANTHFKLGRITGFKKC